MDINLIFMDFYTPVSYPKVTFRISYSDSIMLLGSCFVENMGNRLEQYKFKTDINPFGTLYNPLSIASSIERLISPVEFTADDLFQSGGQFHSFQHHSRFSASSVEETLDLMNTRLSSSASFFSQCSCLLVTFGTAWVYRLRKTGKDVANCHKLPESEFIRERLTPEQIVNVWKDLLERIYRNHPGIRVLFTVSPIRHWKDGAHGNQLSKAVLLLAIDALCEYFPALQCEYFPAYEIMMDELRNYRFYAEDMIHPSSTAVSYIWEKFLENKVAPQSMEIMKSCKEIQKAVEHRPFNPQSAAYRQFIIQTLLKIERLNDKFPYFDFSKEKEYLNSKLK